MGKGRKRLRRKKTVTQPPELVQIPPQHVAEVWPLAEALLAPELPNLDSTPEQLGAACEMGGAVLWMIMDHDDKAHAALVTVNTPHGKCIVIACCGENLLDYLDTREQLYGWAKEQGMNEVVFYGRDALAKLMPECKRKGVILRKEL